ncbi:unnamed protein product [Pleuronectes platessa]|uniref:Uncharacterized protein n=1 Tax=Pleuronectes platessa TaxID=8262 RepID=A0A9N7TMK8_PLEPL|nr:unnamed protein product [Pleuronectes platessa]
MGETEHNSPHALRSIVRRKTGMLEEGGITLPGCPNNTVVQREAECCAHTLICLQGVSWQPCLFALREPEKRRRPQTFCSTIKED